MLGKLASYFSHHVQAANSSLKSLTAKPFAFIMTVTVLALTLTLPALFWVCSDNLQNIMKHWQHSSYISLYLKTSLVPEQQSQTLKKIRVMQGVGDAKLKSPEAGIIELQSQEGMQDIMAYLPENPLPPVIEVIPSMQTNTPEEMASLFERLRNIPEVAQAKLDAQWVKRLYAIIHFIANLTKGLIFLLALGVVFIIGNTLRLAIHNRQEEIQILKLIGAPDTYILRPFLYSGIWYGFSGAVLAIVFINAFLILLSFAANQLAAAYQMHFDLIGLTVRQILFLMLAAMVLGWIAARLTVKRQLSTIEPY